MHVRNIGIFTLCLLLATSSLSADPKPEKEYRSLTLDNGMEVFLVHDPEADHSAAALAVHAGSMHDGKRPGIAHFLEHMLFLGTKKYPNAGEYKDYLAANDGQSNAYTAYDHTTYMFEVKNQAYDGALDRFAQFFIDPLLTDELSERELNAVDSEHSKNLNDEYWRSRQVYRSLVNPKHPHCSFATGNSKTLAGVQNEELRAFYEAHYSSGLMHLCLVSNAKLEKLESLARELFTAIPDRGLRQPTVTEKLFWPEIAGHRVDIQSLTDIRQLWIKFELPGVVFDHESKPGNVIGSVLGHEGKESLLQQLKKEGLATSLSAGPRGLGSQGTFNLTLGLTQDGLQKVDVILERIFAMINHMRSQERLPDYIHEQAQNMSAIDFRFRTSSTAFSEAQGLSASMIRLPHEKLLESIYLIQQRDDALIRKVLDALIPENAVVFVISKDRETDQVEPHYNTRYRKQPLSPELIENLQTAKPTKAMALPAENAFIPSDFALVETRYNDPPAIKKFEFGEIWLRHDVRFQQPKAVLKIGILNRLNHQSARDFVLGALFARSVNEALNPHQYPMSEAGMNLGIASDRGGLTVIAGGYSHKLPDLLAFATPFLTEVRIDKAKYEIFHEAMVRGLKNKVKQPALRHAFDVFRQLIREVNFTDAEQLAALETITFDDLKAYPSRAFRKIYMRGFVYGNLTLEQVETAATTLQKALNPESVLPESERFAGRILRLGDGTSAILRRPIDSNDSAAVLLYQGNPLSIESKAALTLLNQILPNRFFQDLRTLQQTGYIVDARGFDIEDIPVFYFASQSSVIDTASLRGRFEAFIKHLDKELSKISAEDFEKNRAAALNQVLSKRKTFAEELTWNYHCAFNLQGDFEFESRLENALKNMDQKKWLALCSSFFAERNTRRVSIEMIGSSKRHRYQESSLESLREKGNGYWKRPATPPQPEGEKQGGSDR